MFTIKKTLIISCLLVLNISINEAILSQENKPILSEVIAGYYENFENEFLSELVCNAEYKAAYLLLKRMISRTNDNYWRGFTNADEILANKTAALLHANASLLAANLLKDEKLATFHFQEFSKIFPDYKVNDLDKFSTVECPK